MLARLEARAAAEGPQRHEWKPRNWQGAKYDPDAPYMRTVDTAKLIRADIKLAVKIAKQAAAAGSVAVFDAFAAAPAALKYSVSVPHHGSISIKVKNIPAAWGYVRQDRYGNGQEYDYPSEALRALGRELAGIANAYNYDNSDSMTDYYDKNFYLSVTDEHGMGIDH